MTFLKNHYSSIIFIAITTIFWILMWIQLFLRIDTFDSLLKIFWNYTMIITILAFIIGIVEWWKKDALKIPFIIFIASLLCILYHNVVIPIRAWTFQFSMLNRVLIAIIPIFFYLIFYLSYNKKINKYRTIILTLIVLLYIWYRLYGFLADSYNDIKEIWISFFEASLNTLYSLITVTFNITLYPMISSLIWIWINKWYHYFKDKKANNK